MPAIPIARNWILNTNGLFLPIDNANWVKIYIKTTISCLWIICFVGMGGFQFILNFMNHWLSPIGNNPSRQIIGAWVCACAVVFFLIQFLVIRKKCRFDKKLPKQRIYQLTMRGPDGFNKNAIKETTFIPEDHVHWKWHDCGHCINQLKPRT
ncbi:hypothetical protein [Paraburkholderia fungorum]|uniref:hypothetical protein n=1 Tax=Paraburkholderia fungorum TaxID=134537 RepID=UPI0038BBB500